MILMKVNVLGTDGKTRTEAEAQTAFNEKVREDIIRRAVLSENSTLLQPQAHSVMAGIQTTATYYGAMSSYRTGRHVGHAIRPREKLGGGVQGKVKRIPSAVKGRRAHPHMVEKTLIERINTKEYRKAIRGAVAATASKDYVRERLEGVALPIVVADEIESISRTKEVMKVLDNLKLKGFIESCRNSKHIKRGRSGNERHYKKSVLLVVSKKGVPVEKAARNIAGADVCDIHSVKADLLAPGGRPGRVVIWSESAFKNIDAAIEEMRSPTAVR